MHRITISLLLLLSSVFLNAAKENKDKSKPKFYDPVMKDIEGWTIKVDPSLLK